MFDAAIMARIRKQIGPSNLDDDELQVALVRVGEWARSVIDTTPTGFERGPRDVPLTERARWIGASIVNPGQRLRKALQELPMLAPYPDAYPDLPQVGSLAKLDELLAEIIDYAAGLRLDLHQRIRERSNGTTELTAEIISRLIEVFRKAGVAIVRREYVKGTGDPGVLATLLEICLEEIVGEKVPVDHHLKDFVKVERWRNGGEQ